MVLSLFIVYCSIMFNVAEAKIIRHINKAFHNETLAYFSVPKRKSAGKKESIVALRYSPTPPLRPLKDGGRKLIEFTLRNICPHRSVFFAKQWVEVGYIIRVVLKACYVCP